MITDLDCDQIPLQIRAHFYFQGDSIREEALSNGLYKAHAYSITKIEKVSVGIPLQWSRTSVMVSQINCSLHRLFIIT